MTAPAPQSSTIIQNHIAKKAPSRHDITCCSSPSYEVALQEEHTPRAEYFLRHDSERQEVSTRDGVGLRFPRTILVQVEGRWHVVGAADEALRCLRNVFPDRNGPSHRGAVDTCAAMLLGNTTAEGAHATFIVTAMEGGHPFEVHDDGP